MKGSVPFIRSPLSVGLEEPTSLARQDAAVRTPADPRDSLHLDEVRANELARRGTAAGSAALATRVSERGILDLELETQRVGSTDVEHRCPRRRAEGGVSGARQPRVLVADFARPKDREKAERIDDVREERLRRGDTVGRVNAAVEHRELAGARGAPVPRHAAPHAPIIVVKRLRAIRSEERRGGE